MKAVLSGTLILAMIVRSILGGKHYEAMNHGLDFPAVTAARLVALCHWICHGPKAQRFAQPSPKGWVSVSDPTIRSSGPNICNATATKRSDLWPFNLIGPHLAQTDGLG